MIGLGYEGLTIDQFCADVARLGVSMVVDVRLNALSGQPGFSKNSLRAALAGIGVEYLHLPALGNPRDNRSGFRYPESAAGREARERYGAIVLSPAGNRAIEDLADLANVETLGILCFERDQQACHCQVVMDHLEARLLACG